MKLISWNVNGIRAVWKKGFEEFVYTHQPDILCLQETKIDADKLAKEKLTLEGYRQYSTFANRKGYSGVTTFVRSEVHVEEDNIAHGIGHPEFDSEGRFLVSRHKDFILYNMYIPSGTTGDERQQYKYQLLDALRIHLANLDQEDRERLILCGDFNICHLDFDIHHPDTATKRQLSGFLPEERAWIDGLISDGFVDTYRQHNPEQRDSYTWWSYRAQSRQKNLGWRIDYFFASRAFQYQVASAKIHHEVTGSDHCPIEITVTPSK